MLSADWGSVPQWVAAGAVVIALLGYVSSRRDASRRLASGVYLIHKRTHAHVGPGVSTLETEVVIHNDGDAPISGVSLALFEPGRRRRFWWRHAAQQRWWTSARVMGVVYPTLTPRGEAEPYEYSGVYPPYSDPDFRPPFTIAFRDGEGREWVRWPDGRLSRVRRWLRLLTRR